MAAPPWRERVTSNFRLEELWRTYAGDYQMVFKVPVSTFYSQIIDKVNVRSSVGFPRSYPVAPVKHLQYRATDGFCVDFTGVNGYVNTINSRNRMPLSPEWVSFLVPSVPDDILRDFAHEAFINFDTQIPERVQTLNFLAALPKIGSLIPSISGALGKDASGAILSDEFGRRNFLKDVEQFISLVSDVQADLQKLRDEYGKEIRLGFSQKIGWSPLNNLPLDRTFVYFHPTAGWGWRCELLKYDAFLRAGGYRFHMLKDLDRTLSVIRGCLSALGFGNPVKLIWDAIPLSFILGWLTNLGGLLTERNVRHLFEGEWSLRHLSTSVTIKAELRVLQWNENEGIPPWSGMPMLQTSAPIFVQAKRYERYFGLPLDVGSFLHTRVLSSKQFELLAALGTQFGSL